MTLSYRYKYKIDCIHSSISFVPSDVKDQQTRAMSDEASSEFLFRAVMKGHYKAVKILVDGGADVNATDKNGNSLLLKAVYELQTSSKKMIDTTSSRYKIVRYLIQHGADF